MVSGLLGVKISETNYMQFCMQLVYLKGIFQLVKNFWQIFVFMN